MKITNSVEKNGYPQLIYDCNASTIKEILERVLHSITGKFDSAAPSIPVMIRTLLIENGLEWRVFKYEFEQVDDAQSTLEEFT
jgi:hypothetical protein